MLFEWGGIITVIVEGEEGGVSATQSEIAKIVQATKTDRTMFFKWEPNLHALTQAVQNGGRNRDWTCDPYNVNVVLYRWAMWPLFIIKFLSSFGVLCKNIMQIWNNKAVLSDYFDR